MKKLILSSLFLLASWSFAAEEMGLTPQETYQLKMESETPVLFVDVRDPVEIMFVGSTDVVDLNIPFLIVDRTEWSDERGAFKMNKNDQFAEEVAAALEARNLPKETMIITMCRSGSERGKPSAETLRDAGFTNAHYVVNGFQGDVIKEGEMKGFRLQNGWQNSDLPWGAKMSGDKIYRTDAGDAVKADTEVAEKAIEAAATDTETATNAALDQAEVVVESDAATVEDEAADKKSHLNEMKEDLKNAVDNASDSVKDVLEQQKENLDNAVDKAKEFFDHKKDDLNNLKEMPKKEDAPAVIIEEVAA
nr:rhodanese-like domain-containing protein [Ignatzschineria sp. F8392]